MILKSSAALIIVLALTAPTPPTAYVWLNVKDYPKDLTTTADAWSAVRGETPDKSYRIAADDFVLTQPTHITSIEFWSAEVGTPHILGGDWYIFAGGGSGPPGALLKAGPGKPMLHEDTGLTNPNFGIVYRNVIEVKNLFLPAGHYFLAFRTYQLIDYGSPTKDTNGAFTTRWEKGLSRGWWNFDVLGDGSVTGPWVPMSQFNLAQNEWSFRIDGEVLGPAGVPQTP